MSWLCSQVLVEAFLAATSSDGEPSAPSNSTPTPQAYCAPDKMTAFSRLSRFGMTFGPLTADRGEELLTWFLAAFPARTSALQERAQASTANAPASGPSSLASSTKSGPCTHGLKTPQLSLLADSNESLETLPRSGMTRDGVCWELPILVRRTSASASGFRLPTPTAHNAKEYASPSEWTRNEPTLATHAGGPLNPTWVEWLMGWPLGWTDLKPLATARFREWLRQHGGCLVNSPWTPSICPPAATPAHGSTFADDTGAGESHPCGGGLGALAHIAEGAQ